MSHAEFVELKISPITSEIPVKADLRKAASGPKGAMANLYKLSL